MKSSSERISYNDFFEKCQEKRRNLSNWGAQEMQTILDSYSYPEHYSIDQSMRNGPNEIKEIHARHINHSYTDYSKVRQYSSNAFMLVLLESYAAYADLKMKEAIKEGRLQEVVNYIQTYPINLKVELDALKAYRKVDKQEKLKLGFTKKELVSLCDADPDEQGNSFLHLAALKMSTVQFKNFVHNIPEDIREGVILKENNDGKSVIDIVRHNFDMLKEVMPYVNYDIYPSRLPVGVGSPTIEDVFRICDELRNESPKWDWGHKEKHEYNKWKPKIMFNIVGLYTEEEKFSIFKSMRESPRQSDIRVVFDSHMNPAYKTYKDAVRFSHYDSFIKSISHGYNNYCAFRYAAAKKEAELKKQSNRDQDKLGEQSNKDDIKLDYAVSKKLPMNIQESIKQHQIEKEAVEQARIEKEAVKKQAIESHYHELTSGLSESQRVSILASDMLLRMDAINIISGDSELFNLVMNKLDKSIKGSNNTDKSSSNFQDREDSRRNRTKREEGKELEKGSRDYQGAENLRINAKGSKAREL